MDALKVFFVIPPYFNISDFVNKQKANVLPAFTIPYGVLSLDAYLKAKCQRKIDTIIIDLNVPLKKVLAEPLQHNLLELLIESVMGRVRECKPDLICISALFNISFRYLEDIAHAIKTVGEDLIVVAGGGLPSAAFDKVLDLCPSIDAICIGEGEIPLKDLLDSTDWESTLETHKSWITRLGIEKGKTPGHTFVQNLDDIPALNYDAVNLDDYNSRSIDKRYAEHQKREMTIHTSRGCPFHCVFCSNPSLHGQTVRTMSIDKVVSEVQRMKDEYGMTVLMIEDDHFLHDKDRAKEIMRRLSVFAIRIEFPNGVAVYAIDEEIAALFNKAGVSTVALGVESGSAYVLKRIMNKPLNKRLIKPAVENLRKHGVQSHVFIVIGLPGEMPEHRMETLEMMLNVGFDWAHIYCATPIFGSRLYDICVDNGYIDNTNTLDFINTKSVIRAPGVDPDEIATVAYDMNLTVNFVHNYNMKIGNYATAITYFKNVCDKYPDHAFGHYFLWRAYIESGLDENIGSKHHGLFTQIVSKDTWWMEKSEKYELMLG